MLGLVLLASGLLIPLLAFALIRFSRDNVFLLLRLLAGTGILCGVLAWISNLGDFNSGGVWLPSYEIFPVFPAISSQIAGALLTAAWILALFQSVRERSNKWISLLVVSGIIAYLASAFYQYSGLITLEQSIFIPNSLPLETGVYAVTLLGGVTAFMYGVRRSTPSGLQQDTQDVLYDDTISAITREPL